MLSNVVPPELLAPELRRTSFMEVPKENRKRNRQSITLSPPGF